MLAILSLGTSPASNLVAKFANNSPKLLPIAASTSPSVTN